MKYLKSKYIKIKSFFISLFSSDYEKTKAEIKALKQNIYNLIKKENELIFYASRRH